MKTIIAVDFDGCLCQNKFPDIGPPNYPVIDELINRQIDDGCKIILWTCRRSEQLEEALVWCKNRGLRFDAVNENLPEIIEMFGGDCRKVYAHEYWDDRAVRKWYP